MGREIRKKKDWLGNETEVVYEDNAKVGETRHETNIWGTSVDRTYDNEGHRVNETRHEKTITGTPVDRTYDNEGHRISETRHEKSFTGAPVDRTYDNDGNRISETRREKTFWGTKIKRVYETEHKSGARFGGGQSVTGSPISIGLAGFFIIAAVAAALIVGAYEAVQNRQGPMQSVTTLEGTRTAIPDLLNRLYANLNQGDLSAARSLVTPSIASNARTLDYICRPFAYRAHYVEETIERPGAEFLARVHVLFEPEEERIYVMHFRYIQRRLVLSEVTDAYEDWLGPERQTALNLGREFAYAAKANRKDVLAQIVTPSLDLSQLYNDAEYRSRLKAMGDFVYQQVDLRPYHGLKFEVRLYSTRGICSDAWVFLVDRVHGESKIVKWEFTPIVGCYSLFKSYSSVEDSNLKSYTLERFGLRSATK